MTKCAPARRGMRRPFESYLNRFYLATINKVDRETRARLAFKKLKVTLFRVCQFVFITLVIKISFPINVTN